MKPLNPALTILLAEIKSDKRLNLKVPHVLKSPDLLVQKTREELKERTYLDNGLLRCFDNLDIQVSPKNQERSLCFMDTLIKALKARGHTVHNEHRSTYTVIRAEKIKISFREKLKTISSGDKYNSRKLEPTGILNFRAEINFNVKEWLEGQQTLEEQLPRILAELEIQADKLVVQSIERKQYWDEQKAKDQLIQDEINRQETELIKFKLLINKAKHWRDANLIRDYANSLQDVSEKEWILKKADWYDPNVEFNDELLKDVDKDTLVLRKK